uniref:basic proline-rich protein-like n=1 Tax=Macaca mulatta TaxID=9544 RepID=UPI0010A2972F|nr:basic proline-rich protein-like [Macaca mulatta]
MTLEAPWLALSLAPPPSAPRCTPSTPPTPEGFQNFYRTSIRPQLRPAPPPFPLRPRRGPAGQPGRAVGSEGQGRQRQRATEEGRKPGLHPCPRIPTHSPPGSRPALGQEPGGGSRPAPRRAEAAWAAAAAGTTPGSRGSGDVFSGCGAGKLAAAVEAAASGCGRGARRDPPPPPPPQLPPPPAAPAPRRTRALAARAPPAPTGPTPTGFSQGPALPAVPNRLCPNCARATLRGPPPPRPFAPGRLRGNPRPACARLLQGSPRLFPPPSNQIGRGARSPGDA